MSFFTWRTTLQRKAISTLSHIPTEALITGPDSKNTTLGKIFESSFRNEQNVFIASSEAKKAVEGLFLSKVPIPYYAAEDIGSSNELLICPAA